MTTVSAHAQVDYTIKREKSAAFKIDLPTLADGKIQVFFELSDSNGVPTLADDIFNETRGKSTSNKRLSVIDLQKP